MPDGGLLLWGEAVSPEERPRDFHFQPRAAPAPAALRWGVTFLAALIAAASGAALLDRGQVWLAASSGASLYNSGQPGKAFPYVKLASRESRLQATSCQVMGDMAVWAIDDGGFQSFYKFDDPWSLAKLALYSYAEALDRQPGSSKAWGGMAELFKKSRILRIKQGVVDLDLIDTGEPPSFEEEDQLVIEAYRHALRFEPNNYFYHAYLGDFYGERGFRDHSLKSYARAVEIMPDLSWHYYLPRENLAPGFYAPLRAALELALTTNRSYPMERVYQNLGDLAERGEDKAAAEGYYKRAAAVARDPSPYLQMLGVLYFGMKRYEEADGTLERALERGTLQPRMNALAHTLLGRSASLRGDVAGAVEHLKKAKWMYPAASYIAIDLARAYEAQGKLDLAESEFKSAIQVDPARAGAYTALIEMYRRTQQLNKALPLAKRLVEMYPDQSVFREQLRTLNRELGRPDKS